MGDEGQGVQLTLCDEAQGLGAVAAVHTTGLEGQIFAVHIRQRQGLRPVVERHHRYDSVGAGALPCQTEGGLRPRYLQHHIRAAVVAVGLYEGQTVLRRDGEHLRIVAVEEADAALVLLAHDDAFGLLQHHAQQSADAGGACPNDQYRVLRRDLGDARRPEASGQHIAHQQRLPVGNAVGDLIQALIGKEYPHILRLSAVDAAAQRPAAVFVGAVVHIAPLAEKAIAAEGLHIHRYPVAGLHMGHGAAHGLHHAHHLVAHGDARHGPGNAAVLDVQVAGADAGQRHLHDGVPLVEQHRLGLFRQRKFSLCNICISLHCVIHHFLKIYFGAALRRGSPYCVLSYHGFSQSTSTAGQVSASALSEAGWEVDTGSENCYTACIPINFGVCDNLEVDDGPDPYCCRFQL